VVLVACEPSIQATKCIPLFGPVFHDGVRGKPDDRVHSVFINSSIIDTVFTEIYIKITGNILRLLNSAFRLLLSGFCLFYCTDKMSDSVLELLVLHD
jgi:hypothetical protein